MSEDNLIELSQAFSDDSSKQDEEMFVVLGEDSLSLVSGAEAVF